MCTKYHHNMHKTTNMDYIEAPVIRDTYFIIWTDTNKNTHTTCGVNKVAHIKV